MPISQHLRVTRRPAETAIEARQWWTYLPEAGPEARAWCAAYEQQGLEISKRTGLVVRDLQRRRLERARLELAGCRADLEGMRRTSPRPVATVVEVAYLSVLAYYHYHAAELEAAREILAKAGSLIEETIDLAPFLVPCAGQCYDYRLHLARIARAESRWDEMFTQIRIGRQMVYGELPLCQTVVGNVYLKDVCAFYGNATALNNLEQEALRLQSDPKTIQREFEGHCLLATIPPFIVFNDSDS